MYLKGLNAAISVLLIVLGAEGFAASKHAVPSSSSTKISFTVNVQQPLKSGDNILLRESFKPCLAASPACTLVMYQNSASATLQITNTSNTVAIHNMQAYNLPAGVTQDASDCTLIPPGGTCSLIFTPGSILNSGAVVTLYGTNTTQSTVIFQILSMPPIVVLGAYDLPNERLVVRYTSNDYGTTWSSMLVLPNPPADNSYSPGWTTCGTSGENCLSTVSLADTLGAFSYTSVDFGNQWVASPDFALPLPPLNMLNLQIIGNSCNNLMQNCVAVGSYTDNSFESFPIVYRSSDGGASWIQAAAIPQPINTEYALDDVFCSSNGLTCIAAGRKGQPQPLEDPAAYKTLDGGITWVELTIPSTQTIQTINRITCDSNVVRCFIVGNYDNGGNGLPIVYATQDSGTTWSETTLTPIPPNSNLFQDNIRSISCSGDASKCVIVGSYVNTDSLNKAFSYYTTNTGTTWTLSTNFPNPVGIDETDLNDVFCTNTMSRCMAVGRGFDTLNAVWNPLTYITTNGGVNWSLTPTQPNPDPLNSISLLNVSGGR